MMSGDELVVLGGSFILALACWPAWHYRLLSVRSLGGVAWLKGMTLMTPLACFVAMTKLLEAYSASDVRDSSTYMTFYVVMGLAWVGLSVRAMNWLNIRVVEDVAERRNAAAAWTVIGALAGLTCCYAGANFGEGPGWWVVVFCALLATTGLLLAWLAVELFAGISETITVGRDLATGMRFGAFLLACGLILGRAVAGNWQSASGTVLDFVRFGWPVAAMAMVEIVLAKATRNNPANCEFTIGLLPGLAYLTAAGLILVARGWW